MARGPARPGGDQGWGGNSEQRGGRTRHLQRPGPKHTGAATTASRRPHLGLPGRDSADARLPTQYWRPILNALPWLWSEKEVRAEGKAHPRDPESPLRGPRGAASHRRSLCLL